MHLSPVKLQAGTFDGPEFEKAFASAIRKAESFSACGLNDAALSSGSAAIAPRVGNSSKPKTPNFDRSGLLVVRRNSIVGRDGLRFRVVSVRLGFCCVRQVDCNMRPYLDLPVETKACNYFYVVG